MEKFKQNLFDVAEAKPHKANNSEFIDLVHLQCVTFRFKKMSRSRAPKKKIKFCVLIEINWGINF